MQLEKYFALYIKGIITPDLAKAGVYWYLTTSNGLKWILNILKSTFEHVLQTKDYLRGSILKTLNQTYKRDSKYIYI